MSKRRRYEERELWTHTPNGNLYGVAYVPEGEGPFPAIVMSHGFGVNHTYVDAYAKAMAMRGYAAYAIDFCGGGRGSRSDMTMLEMSPMTEVADLEAALLNFARQDFVDASRVALMGESQGGFVSAVTAARHVDDVAGLVLLYPAFVLVDDNTRPFASRDDIPETYQALGGITVGHRYAWDVYDYDVYGEIGAYEKPVLIVHGDADPIVPLAYSERARDTYREAELRVIPGAGHGFHGTDFALAAGCLAEYCEQILGR